MKDDKPTNWKQIELQKKIDAISIVSSILVYYKLARETGNSDLLRFIENLTWTWDQHSVIELPEGVETVLFSEISDALPITDEVLDKEIETLGNKTKEYSEEILRINKERYPEVYKNN